MFPTKILELLLDELSFKLKNPKLVESFTVDDLVWMFMSYRHIRSYDDKIVMATHLIAEIILIERGLIKG